jgi:hypothetical protein
MFVSSSLTLGTKKRRKIMSGKRIPASTLAISNMKKYSKKILDTIVKKQFPQGKSYISGEYLKGSIRLHKMWGYTMYLRLWISKLGYSRTIRNILKNIRN